MNNKNNKKVFLSVAFLILSIFSTITWNIAYHHDFHISGLPEMFGFLLKTVVFFTLYMIAYKFLTFFGRSENILQTKGRFIDFTWSKKNILTITAVLFAVYFIYLIIFYPGVCNYDTTNEIMDLTTKNHPLPYGWITGQPKVSALMNDHHPITCTVIFTAFYEFGKLLGSANLGIFIYNLIQSFLTAFAFSLMICSMDRWNRKVKHIQTVSFFFLAIMPFVPMYVVNMVKDSLFGFIFVIYFTYYMLILFEGADRRKLLVIIITSLLLSLTKKTGLYIIIICNLALLLRKPVRKSIQCVVHVSISILVPAIILMIIFPKILFPALNIYKGGPQEGINFCLQQVSRVVYDNEADLSEEELATIDKIIPLEKIRYDFNHTTADGVKIHFNYYATSEDISDFMKLWFKLFFRYPNKYIEATLGTSGSYFIPNKSISVYTKLVDNSIGIYSPKGTEKFRNEFTEVYNTLCNIPGLNLLFSLALYCWIIPVICIIYLIKQRDWNSLLSLIPIILSIMVLFITPLTYGRYAVVHFYTIPLILGLFASPRTSEEKKTPEA